MPALHVCMESLDHHNGACAVWHCRLGVVGSPDHYNKPCIVSNSSLCVDMGSKLVISA